MFMAPLDSPRSTAFAAVNLFFPLCTYFNLQQKGSNRLKPDFFTRNVKCGFKQY